MRLGGRTGPGSMPRWSAWETDVLVRCHANNPDAKLAEYLERSISSVKAKAHMLKLKKSKKRLREMGKQNVKRRYA